MKEMNTAANHSSLFTGSFSKPLLAFQLFGGGETEGWSDVHLALRNHTNSNTSGVISHLDYLEFCRRLQPTVTDSLTTESCHIGNISTVMKSVFSKE